MESRCFRWVGEVRARRRIGSRGPEEVRVGLPPPEPGTGGPVARRAGSVAHSPRLFALLGCRPLARPRSAFAEHERNAVPDQSEAVEVSSGVVSIELRGCANVALCL